MVFLFLLSALLSFNVKRIIKNWIDTKGQAVGNTIKLKIKKNRTKSIETGTLMVFLCLLSALLSYNVKRIIENWKDTKAKAVGKTIELKIKKNSTKSIETGALMVFLCLLSALLSYNVKKNNKKLERY